MIKIFLYFSVESFVVAEDDNVEIDNSTMNATSSVHIDDEQCYSYPIARFLLSGLLICEISKLVIGCYRIVRKYMKKQRQVNQTPTVRFNVLSNQNTTSGGESEGLPDQVLLIM